MSAGKLELVSGAQPEGRPASPVEPDATARTETAASPRAGPWMDKRQRSYFALLVLTAGALYTAYLIYRPFLTSLFLAIVLTVAFLPIHERIARRVRGNTWAALLTTTIVVLLIMVPLLLLSVRLASEAASLYSYISQQGGTAWSTRSAWFSEGVQRIADQTGLPATQIRSTVTARIQEAGSWLVGMAGWAVRGFAQQVTTAILALLVLFFCLRD